MKYQAQAILALVAALSHDVSAITNPSPPVLHEGFADPRIYLEDGTYYAFATNHFGGKPSRNVPVATSTHFSTGWKPNDANLLPNPGDWTHKKNGNAGVWDPSVAKYRDHYVMYYAAKVNANVHCIGAATSKTLLGEYTPQGSPFICPGTASGTGAISPNPFSIGDEHYVVYKNGSKSDAGLYVQRLTADGASIDKAHKPHLLLHATKEDYDTEGPTLIRNPENGHFILLFVTGFYKDDNYGIQYASSPTLVPAGGKQYTRHGYLLKTPGINGVDLYAPGGPDFATAEQMSFMTFRNKTIESGRVMRTANVTYTADNKLSIKPNM